MGEERGDGGGDGEEEGGGEEVATRFTPSKRTLKESPSLGGLPTGSGPSSWGSQAFI